MPLARKPEVSRKLFPSARTSANDEEKGPKQTPTVTVIDDDVTVRSLAVRTLHRGVFHCLPMKIDAEAIRCMQENPEPDATMIVKATMPERGGIGLARQLRERRPALKVGRMGGLAEAPADQMLKEGVEGFLPKLFQVDSLIGAIQSAPGARNGRAEDINRADSVAHRQCGVSRLPAFIGSDYLRSAPDERRFLSTCLSMGCDVWYFS